MSVSITVSDELYEQARSIAEAHHIAVDDVFAMAFAEQFSAWQRIQERAKRGDRDKFVAVLNKVPDIQPEAYDRI
jgi:predicted transcriptional regulator